MTTKEKQVIDDLSFMVFRLASMLTKHDLSKEELREIAYLDKMLIGACETIEEIKTT